MVVRSPARSCRNSPALAATPLSLRPVSSGSALPAYAHAFLPRGGVSGPAAPPTRGEQLRRWCRAPPLELFFGFCPEVARLSPLSPRSLPPLGGESARGWCPGACGPPPPYRRRPPRGDWVPLPQAQRTPIIAAAQGSSRALVGVAPLRSLLRFFRRWGLTFSGACATMAVRGWFGRVRRAPPARVSAASIEGLPKGGPFFFWPAGGALFAHHSAGPRYREPLRPNGFFSG